ncbi:DUF3256 family protein [Porphyromonas sp.]|uniref:DUF3256 family protein n=1 Tax=Porphyromonas sp. TaxID=1924944 RepID=UPI0026DD5938|nr:DUF3256 family protein [Porphyromonas sp.]MDO4771219.1 DUF3256 family protein [Porphyromonas sp.]
MRKIYILIMTVVLTLQGSTLSAQEIKDLFIEVPEQLLPILPKTARSKMLSLYLSDPKGKSIDHTVTNPLGGSAMIHHLTSSYIRLSPDKHTELQYKLLRTDDGTTIIGMIATSCVPPRQSVIKFYDREWKELSTGSIIEQFPRSEDFLKNAKDSTLLVFKNAMVERGSLDLYANFGAETPTLTMYTSTFDDEMARRLHPDLLPLLNNEGIKYTWQKGKMKRTK